MTETTHWAPVTGHPKPFDQDDPDPGNPGNPKSCSHRKAREVTDFDDRENGVRVYLCDNCGLVELPCSPSG